MTRKEQLKEQIRQQYYAGEYDFEQLNFSWVNWDFSKREYDTYVKVYVDSPCGGYCYNMKIPKNTHVDDYVKAVYAFYKVVRGGV